METKRVRQIVKQWVAENAPRYPGLMAAHLTGSITSLPDDAPYPAYKDVDFHLIFKEDSPALQPNGPLPFAVVDVLHHGLMLEGGLKSVSLYRSAEAVLGNPEIAEHLRQANSILYDPTGQLAALHEPIAREFSNPGWVRTRIAYERRAYGENVALLPMSKQMGGSASAMEALLYGGTFRFISAALCIATLRPLSTGSRSMLRMREVLADEGRLDFYDEVLQVWGVFDASETQAREMLKIGIKAFDLAMVVKSKPHVLDFKLQPHLRPYFVEACKSLLSEGYPREMLLWLSLFYLLACDVIVADGDEAQKTEYAEHATHLLALLNLDTSFARATRWEQAHQLARRGFDLADEIASRAVVFAF